MSRDCGCKSVGPHVNEHAVGVAMDAMHREHDVRASGESLQTFLRAYFKADALDRELAALRRRVDEHLGRESGSCGGLS